MKPLHELIPVLQVAVGPVILISGVGLLLLTLTNRFGRAVDRSRFLVRELREMQGDRASVEAQIEILVRRAKWIRLAITLAAISVLLTALLIIVLFLAALLDFEGGLLISLIFIGCMTALIVSIGAFVFEVHLSLKALHLDVAGAKAAKG